MNEHDRTSARNPLAKPDQNPSAEHQEGLQLDSIILALDEAISGGLPAKAIVANASLTQPSTLKLEGIKQALQLLEQARLDGALSNEVEPVANCRDTEAIARPDVVGQTIGHFDLLEELGRGGFGVVFLAQDRDLGRQVALKIPRPEVLAGPEPRKRFLREARAAGVLEHPNLISVYEVGEDGPFCFLATAYCAGPTLAQWLHDQTESVDPWLAAQLARDVARGVEHAHSRGVLHRDIKPSNVLLEDASDSRHPGVCWIPKLTDFGLAKLMDLSDEETRTGVLLGTPAYMSPEQADGRLRDIGPRTDIYALGVLLFEILCGRPPLRGETDVHTLQLVSAGDVPPMAQLRRGIPRDLEAIALRCLERDPEKRYLSAGAMADDLQRFLDGVPTEARPATALNTILKKARRRPAALIMTGLICVTLGMLLGGRSWYSRQLDTARTAVEKVKQDRRQYRYVTSLNLANRAITTNHVQDARQQLARWIPADGEADMRDFAWQYLWRRLNEQELTLSGHEGDIYCVRYSPDGRLLATASADHTARIWNASTGHRLLELRGHSGEVNCVAFSPSGEHLASASDDGTICIWNSTNGELVQRLPPREKGLWGVAFSPDRNLLASCGREPQVDLYETANWNRVARLQAHQDEVGALAFSNSGELLATASNDKTVRIWNVATRKAVHRLNHESAVTCLAFDKQDQRLAVGLRFGRAVQLWDLASVTKLPIRSSHHEIVHGVSFDLSGKHFGVVTKEGVVELLNTADGSVSRRIHGHDERVWSITFSPDGQHFATAGAGRTVKIWDLTSSNPLRIPNAVAEIKRFDMTPDGRFLAVGHWRGDGRIIVYDTASRQSVWESQRDFDLVGDFDGDGLRDTGYFQAGVWGLKLAAQADESSGASVVRQFGKATDTPIVGDWDGDGRDDLGTFDGISKWQLDLPGGVREIQLAPAAEPLGQVIPFIGRWGEGNIDRIGVADHRDGRWKIRVLLDQGDGQSSFQFPTHDVVLLSGRWQTDAPNSIGVLSQESYAAHAFEFEASRPGTQSSKATSVANAQSPADQTAFDAAKDLSQSYASGPGVSTLAISPDGNLVASSHGDARTKVWDVRTGLRLARLRPHDSPAAVLRFSPDGKMLTVAHVSGDAFEYETVNFSLSRQFQALDAEIRDVRYSPDGQTLAVAGRNGEIKLWNSERKLGFTLRDRTGGAIWGLDFSRDGRLLASGGNSRIVTVWDVRTGEEVLTLAGHTDGINSVSFCPRGEYLVSAADDGTVRLWNLATRLEVYPLLESSPAWQYRAVFTPDGNQIISAGMTNPEDGLRFFWLTSPPAAG